MREQPMSNEAFQRARFAAEQKGQRLFLCPECSHGMADYLVDEKVVAALFGVRTTTTQQWRMQRRGPPFVMV